MATAGAKYDPLRRFLAAQPREVHVLMLTFAEIERLLGAPLPRGAYTATFWANTRETQQGRCWLGAGWRRSHLRVRHAVPEVTFVRVEA